MAVVLTLQNAVGQEIQNEDDALRRAESALLQIQSKYSSVDAKVQVIRSEKGVPWVYSIDGSHNGFNIGLSPDGKIRVFIDWLADEERINRDIETRLKIGVEEAWRIGDNFLKVCGYEPRSYMKVNCNELSLENASKEAKGNGIGTIVLRYEKRDARFEGFFAMAGVILDKETGRVLSFANHEWNFVAPQTELSKTQAVSRLRDLYIIADQEYTEGGQPDVFDWPGDGVIEESLKLQITQMFRACLGSMWGKSLAEDRKARVVWIGGHKNVAIAIDAENGEPVDMFETKASPQAKAVGVNAGTSAKEKLLAMKEQSRAAVKLAGQQTRARLLAEKQWWATVIGVCVVAIVGWNWLKRWRIG